MEFLSLTGHRPKLLATLEKLVGGTVGGDLHNIVSTCKFHSRRADVGLEPAALQV